MLDVRLANPVDLDGWRCQARALIARRIAPEVIAWRVDDEPPDLFASHIADPPEDAAAVIVPRHYAEMVEIVICHRHAARFGLLYRLLWRIARGERRLLEISSDPDVSRADAMARSVRRDLHKMKAFVRFRCTRVADSEHFIAWFEPQHFIVERVAPFFARRFAGILWSILTPDRSVHWDGVALSFAPGADKASMPSEDALEDVWRRYYASIFNPARLNLKATKSQMPVRYWKHLPEARLIAPLITTAAGRTQMMLNAETAARDSSKPQSDRRREPSGGS